MAIKLSKTEAKALNSLAEKLAELRGDVEEAVAAYNDALAEVRAANESIAERLQEEIDAKSDNWRDGDKGQEADQMRADFEGFEAEEIDPPEMPHAEDLESLVSDYGN